MGYRFSEAFGRRQRLVRAARLGIEATRARLMDVGLAIFLTGETMHPAELAQRAEDAGYESLMVTEHTHIPVSAGMVARDGGPLHEKYRRTHDPFVALAFAAAATEKLVVGTSVCLVIEHDPIVLAKQITSLQNLSGGRFVFGDRRGLEQAGDAQPRHRSGHAPRRHARAGRGHEGDLGQRRGRIPRQARELRPDLAVAEARPRAAGLRRRQRPARRGPRPALRRRLDAEHEGDRDARRRGSRRCASAPAATSRSPTTAPRRRTSTCCARRASTAR